HGTRRVLVVSARHRGAARAQHRQGDRRVPPGCRGGSVRHPVRACARRRAPAEDPPATRSALALAGALSSTADRTDEARRILLTVREARPELGEVNLQLARLAAAGGNLPEAARYYHNAIYGVWTGDAERSRPREVRRELVGVLLRT